MIDSLSERISLRIYELNDKKNVSQAVMKYALVSVFTNTITFVLSLVIGILADAFVETIIAMALIALLRTLSGGYHLQSAVLCIVVSTAVITVIPFIPINTTMVLVLTLIAAILNIIYAPSRLRGVTRLTEKALQVRKWLAVAIILSNLVISSDIVSLACFVQAITLISKSRGG
ncbi:accessory gene regulator B family protein [Paenibacillus mendelii]|uniref:Accessory gene regulator B family protein n=1 Tax=Paenibacillus mendelii TaxID=206163 RepID=A0ABV6JBC8_9BACL|nr:accessory gene regulator B family protein [Paenibacillus mendelii]MCQ6559539.1 accessory gene regulator B family protein [Paenibacillus mendelii]